MSTAKSVGAGMLLGGFAFGAAGLMLGWPREDLERRALSDAYAGGLVAVGLLILNTLRRYIV